MDIRLIKKADWKTWAIVALVNLLILSAVVGWYRGQKVKIISKTEYVTVPEIKETVKIKRVEIPVEKIVVIEKEAVAKKLDLPPEIKNDPHIQILATAVIPPYEGKTNVLATLEEKGGRAIIVARQLALPFFDFVNNKEIGLRYGPSFDNTQKADLYGRWDFLRIAGVNLGLYGEVSTSGDAATAISIAYRW